MSKITIDRAVVEQALTTLEGWGNYDKWVWPESALFTAKKNTAEMITALRAALEQPQVEQEPTPNGATHRQPKQGAFYKRVDGKWYVWSRMETGEPHRWYISPGTTESCLEPLYTHPHPPRQPLTDDQIGEIEGWFSNEFGLEAKHSVDFARAIEAAHGITRETK